MITVTRNADYCGMWNGIRTVKSKILYDMVQWDMDCKVKMKYVYVKRLTLLLLLGSATTTVDIM